MSSNPFDQYRTKEIKGDPETVREYLRDDKTSKKLEEIGWEIQRLCLDIDAYIFDLRKAVVVGPGIVARTIREFADAIERVGNDNTSPSKGNVIGQPVGREGGEHSQRWDSPHPAIRNKDAAMTPQDEIMDILAEVVATVSLGEGAVMRRNYNKLAKVSERLRHYANHIDRLAVELSDGKNQKAA